MFIQTEETPDPSVLKFLPGRKVSPRDVTFANVADAKDSPLALRLLAAGAVRVELGPDYIALTKPAKGQWKTLKPGILGAIMDHFTTSAPVAEEKPKAAAAPGGVSADDMGLVTDDEIAEQIIDLLENRIRPVAKDHGGDVVFFGFNPDRGRVHLTFEGAASSLLGGIQTMLRHYVPEVKEVVNHADWIPRPGLETEEGMAVQAVLDEEINPSVASHGGKIRLLDVVDHTAFIRLEGGCHGCGMADVTLKQGVEVAILEKVPTIQAVLDTTDHAEGKNPYYQPGH